MLDGERLESWRREIRAIDEEMISLAARRMKLSEQIGQYKVDNKIPIKDLAVEQEILSRFRKLAESLGVDASFAHALITLVMEESVKVQNKIIPQKP